MTIEVVDLDFENTNQVEQFITILNTYSQEDGAGNQGISKETQAILPSRLNEFPGRQILLAMSEGVAVGVAVCLRGFSTFRAMPVLNLHDLAVLPKSRGQGVGTILLEAAERRARELGCCKLTLEVIENNAGARKLYERLGFSTPSDHGQSLFLEKSLE